MAGTAKGHMPLSLHLFGQNLNPCTAIFLRELSYLFLKWTIVQSTSDRADMYIVSPRNSIFVQHNTFTRHLQHAHTGLYASFTQRRGDGWPVPFDILFDVCSSLLFSRASPPVAVSHITDYRPHSLFVNGTCQWRTYSGFQLRGGVYFSSISGNLFRNHSLAC